MAHTGTMDRVTKERSPSLDYSECLIMKNTKIEVKYFDTLYHLQNISNFMFKPCIDMTILNNNQLMQSQFNIY